VSHAAIAAVLASDDLAAGERLVAFSLASFANRKQVAWPGLAAATARAGLSRSRYLEAREQLVHRGLLEVEERGLGRGRASTVRLLFAESGPWWPGEINAQLVEAVLGYSRTRGSSRLLLAALAALSDGNCVVERLPTDELCRAAGLANSTYRRARAALLASREVTVDGANGGRGQTCRWTVRRPAELGAEPVVQPGRRSAPRRGVRPLVAAVRAVPSSDAIEETAAGVCPVEGNGPALSGVSRQTGPILSGVSGATGPEPSGVSGANPAQTPPETPPPDARAGREPLNPRTQAPQTPQKGGAGEPEVFIEESYRTERGRLRRRRVAVDVEAVCAGFRPPALADAVDWKRIRELLAARLGESTFEIWLAPLELRAIDASGALIIDAPDATRGWVRQRFNRAIAGAGAEASRAVVIADQAQSRSMRALGFGAVGVTTTRTGETPPSCSPTYASYSSSACWLSYTPAYNQAKEAGSW
jgi:hypothetical protein